MLPKNRPPPSPGEVLSEEFLTPLGMTQLQLATKTGMAVQRVNLIVNGKRGVTAETGAEGSLVLARGQPSSRAREGKQGFPSP